MSNYKKVTVISGPVVQALTGGAKIIKQAFDGLNHYLLLELPKGGEWRYAQYETTRETVKKGEDNNVFYLMVTYNGTAREVLQKFTKDYIAKTVHLEKYQPELLNRTVFIPQK